MAAEIASRSEDGLTAGSGDASVESLARFESGVWLPSVEARDLLAAAERCINWLS